MDAQYGSMSGTINGQLTASKKNVVQRKQLSIPAFIGIFAVPSLIFVLVYWLRAFDLHYESPTASLVLCLVLLLPAVAFAGMTVVFAKTGDPVPLAILTITSLIAWIIGFVDGGQTYASFMKPYYDINNLAVYPHVDVERWKGSQLMDAGIVDFTEGSQLVLPKSIGFMNEDVYCVAPVAKTNPKTHTFEPMDNYDFWAVGINCCSGHIPDFHCGEYNNPMAHYGLRLLDDGAREMFRLAVQEAEATYNIKSTHPIFVHWLQDPYAEVNAYQQDGNNHFFGAIGVFCGVQLAVTVVLAVAIAHLPGA